MLHQFSPHCTDNGVPQAPARCVAGLDELHSAFDLVELAEETGRDLRSALRDSLSLHARNLATNALRLSIELTDPEEPMRAGETQHGTQIERSQQLFADIKSLSSTDMPMLSVTLWELRNLA
ncbi:hypothetical protein [Denitromonas iodatirespirans]|uniref:NAD-specific glutamate dehydrogenase C-terminal domain-containing protein n=1 Tax=Denitromonas iodatirespirans TaxID=2795389 RepID=A0A944DFF4_DENI1|nr:hypothetical protein [Denitromonas iodatirespirans]MBT0963388.1 hypothetical protein [Denitromonas iodatirespirans]